MEQLTTGNAALDDVIGGGIPVGSLIVVAGAPGTGKTILAQQIAFANAAVERKALYYTTWSEPHEKLVRHLEHFAFFEPSALGSRVEFLHLAELALAGGLEAAADEILRRSFGERPAVVVIDSSKALHDVVPPDVFRRAIYDLASKIAHSGAVLILVGEYSATETRDEPEFAVADGILQLDNEVHGPTDRRRLRVLKMRGAGIAPGQHSFRLSDAGFEVFPRLETTLPAHPQRLAGRASLGVSEIDALVGGGIPRGDATLLMGPSGVGKTMLSLHFVQGGLEAGERCLYLSFQETEDQLVDKAVAAGMDWRGNENLVVRHVAPVELDLDSVAAIVRTELERGDVKRVVLDSLAELAFASRDTDRFPAYVWALGGYIRAAGGTTLFTNEIAALGHGSDFGGLSFLFNNVLFLRYVEVESELHRGINVLKMRQSDHEKGLTEYTIGPRGIEVVGKVEGVTGLLGWTALRGE